MKNLDIAETILKSAYLRAVSEALEKAEKQKNKPQIKERVICANKTYKAPKESLIGRNDLCPCGSGKKYKKCCMGGKDERI